ncbi:hypothetical protein PSC74_11345 [Aeromonas hydrophila]|uniref:hypothetical protein n=1 Tax=Aeromonas hydrophila TaxID=644 RepID=UPI00235EA638|nr:hypothetical protein [Aeromonas hydrophila]WDA26863.1 hypothetical protein PSC74_11345 [Aeromonas hydrophila]WES92737.1 hypothetical protein PY368_20035 [Aeromonas hydrophila]
MSNKVGELVTEVFENVKQATYGKACLTMGHSTLKRASDAGVSPSQMRAIFEDLQGRSDEQIKGFIEIGEGLVNGSIKISSKAFSEPKFEQSQTE